jgi:hypothetical protein
MATTIQRHRLLFVLLAAMGAFVLAAALSVSTLGATPSSTAFAQEDNGDGDNGDNGDNDNGDNDNGDNGDDDNGYVDDADDAEDAPVGGVEAGFGGTATTTEGTTAPFALAAGLLAAAAAGAVALRRRVLDH